MTTLEIPRLPRAPGAPATPITGSILILERREASRAILGRHFRSHGLHAVETGSPSEALRLASKPACYLVFMGLPHPAAESLELLRRIQEIPSAPAVVVLVEPSTLPLAVQALEAGAFFYMVRPLEPATALLVARRAWEVRMLEAQARSRSTHLTHKQVFDFMSALAEAIDAKSPYTRDHADRVSCLARRLAREIGLGSEEVERVHAGALLHDLGKVGIPDSILDSPEGLSPQERARMQEHPAIGEKILAPIEGMHDLRPIVRSHHENWDGSGYPDGLAGHAIPIEARIVKVADTFDAITTSRPYRASDLTTEEALAMLEMGRGTQFDPELLDCFLEMMRREAPLVPAQG